MGIRGRFQRNIRSDAVLVNLFATPKSKWVQPVIKGREANKDKLTLGTMCSEELHEGRTLNYVITKKAS